MRYGNSGATIVDIKSFADVATYLPYTCKDDEKSFTGEFTYEDAVPERYRNIGLLSDETKTLIETIFRKFASHSPESLGKIINTVINYDGVTDESGVVNLNKIQSLDLEKVMLSSVKEKRNLINFLIEREC